MGNVGETVGGMFDDLKSRLGFNRDAGDAREYDDYSDFDEYAEYGDGFDDDYGDDVGGYRPLSRYAPKPSRYAKTDISSSLVSIDDVKESTPLPDYLNRDPLANLDTGSSSAGASASAGVSAPLPGTSATASAPYDPASALQAAAVPFVPADAQPADAAVAGATAQASAYDPYEAYSSAQPSAHAPVRALTVVNPTAYADVERVARAVKSGDVVVLAMRATPDDLSKRILDFSFGVASALDANVECPGEKIFAIARGNALTLDEKQRLAVQGVL